MANDVQAPIDGAKAFLLYLAFSGNLEQTAVAMDAPLAVLKELALREQWAAKMSELGRSPDGGPAEQQLVNRTVNYVQAHRMRSVLDTVLEHVRDELTTEEGKKRILMSPGKEGDTFSVRAITDLAKAMEACHAMTERALGTPEAAGGKKGAEDVFLSVMKAMNAAEGVGLSSAEVVRAQLKAPAVVARRSLKDALKDQKPA